MVAERRARRVRWAAAEGEGMVVIFTDWFFMFVGAQWSVDDGGNV